MHLVRMSGVPGKSFKSFIYLTLVRYCRGVWGVTPHSIERSLQALLPLFSINYITLTLPYVTPRSLELKTNAFSTKNHRFWSCSYWGKGNNKFFKQEKLISLVCQTREINFSCLKYFSCLNETREINFSCLPNKRN